MTRKGKLRIGPVLEFGRTERVVRGQGRVILEAEGEGKQRIDIDLARNKREFLRVDYKEGAGDGPWRGNDKGETGN